MQRSLLRIADLCAWGFTLVLAGFALPDGARAEAAPPFVCPIDPYLYPAKCEKLARRAERETRLESYRVRHPFRVSLVAEGDLFMLGLGNLYVAGLWGVAAGASFVYENAPPAWALRFDLLGRFGRGHISSWNIDNPGPIDATAGYIGGAELNGALLRRMRAVYLGPVVSLGLLHLRAQTLHAQDFPDEFDGLDHNFHGTVRIPHDAAFLAAGFILGGELTPAGTVGFNLRFTPGIWNDFRHLYADISLAVTAKIWD